MVTRKLRYVHVFEDRHGRRRVYFRHKGRNVALPSDIDSAEFHVAYAACLTGVKTLPVKESKPRPHGSLGALANTYFKSPNFRDLSDATQGEYRRVIDRICKSEGDKPVARLERHHVIAFRDKLSDRRGAANTFVRVLSVLLSYAIDLGWRRDNPARGVKQFKLGEHRAWTDAELARFRDYWAPTTMQRRALELALYTGQRRSDLVSMTKADVEAGSIRVVQSKTGVRVIIPMHQTLQVQLNTGKHDHLALLVTSEGKAFDGVYFGGWFKDAIKDAGLPDDCQLHGLRKTAARMLAEAGCTELEIMAITGHKTSRMVVAYTKDADQRMRANAAILKLERSRR